MRPHATCLLCAALGIVLSANAASFVDPGFENYNVNSGGFVKPTSGPWSFANDAGVTEPFASNSATAVLNTWSATFGAMEGEQYASTYAGADTITQPVTFDAAGDYTISVWAAAPSGTVVIPPDVVPLTCVTGAFTFTLAGNPIGNPFYLAPGTNWTQYSADFTIGKPGIYQLGVWNTAIASYFINYDAFAIVPEPGTLFLLSVVGLSLMRRRS